MHLDGPLWCVIVCVCVKCKSLTGCRVPLTAAIWPQLRSSSPSEMCLAAVSVSVSVSVIEVLEFELLSFTDGDSGGAGSVCSTVAVGGFCGLGRTGENGWMIASSSSSSRATESTLLRERHANKRDRWGITQYEDMFSSNSNLTYIKA